MKRMHIHIGVDHLGQAIAFYSALFGAQPAKLKTDYAKWMLDDPCVNFAISTGAARGVEHLGIQVDSSQELNAMRDRLKAADLTLFDEGETVCCYAQSDKSWIQDPAGVAWEAYQTMGEAAYFHSHDQKPEPASCCEPVKQTNDSTEAQDQAGNTE
ncbi:ArsI/CadI family heavy metal resistance metalloenzyme [Congregibacter litoralis]|uniref:Glyoxalase-like domain protein n=1 Tax=Congregibacter litoralis KT71 TaxID=314285 RepID=A4AE97_9GAMM|nr:ArsI/CadI family heavy metal resistance metalloenzyme [Congregibacter litoralis]EAQ95685.2 Glyoxalase-like domain protein [Congregibacter litoralis KT71]